MAWVTTCLVGLVVQFTILGFCFKKIHSCQKLVFLHYSQCSPPFPVFPHHSQCSPTIPSVPPPFPVFPHHSQCPPTIPSVPPPFPVFPHHSQCSPTIPNRALNYLPQEDQKTNITKIFFHAILLSVDHSKMSLYN